MSSIPSISAEKYYGTKANTSKSTLDMKAFLTLLTEQLSHQNPLEPMSDRDFFAQMAQLGQVQGMDKLNNASEVEQIQNMIGKQVTAVRPMTDGDTGQNDIVQGIATKLVIKDGVRYVSLRQADGGDVEVKVANVQNVESIAKASDYTNLVGRAVTGADEDGAAVSGKVAAIKVVDNGIVLSVEANGKLTDLPLGNIGSIGS